MAISLSASIISLQWVLWGSNQSSGTSSLENFQGSVIRSRNKHKLYKLDYNNLGTVVDWVRENLNNDDTDYLALKFKNQQTWFVRWNWGFSQGATAFLWKDAEHSYCDPFDPEPKVYNGYLVFYPSDLNRDALISSEDPNVQEEFTRRTSIRHGGAVENNYIEIQTDENQSLSEKKLGKLKFTFLVNSNIVRVSMKKKMFSSTYRDFEMNPNQMKKLKGILITMEERKVIPVNYRNIPKGKLFHSLSLKEFIDEVKSEKRVFYHHGDDLMVAGDSKEDEEEGVLFDTQCV